MRSLEISIFLGFSVTVFAADTSWSLHRICTKFESLDDQLLEVSSIIRTLPSIVVNTTATLELYSKGLGVVSTLDRVADILQENGSFSREDGHSIFSTIKQIEPTIFDVIEAISDNVQLLAVHLTQLPDPGVMDKLLTLGSITRRLHRSLGKSIEDHYSKGTDCLRTCFRAFRKLIMHCASQCWDHRKKGSRMTGHLAHRVSVIEALCEAYKKSSAMILPGRNMRLAHLHTLNSGLLSTLSDVSNTYHVPFIRSVTGITSMILETIQSVKAHKSECLVMMERIHEFLCVIVQLCVGSKGNLSPKMLHYVALFAETLQKVQTFLAEQQDKRWIRRFLKHAEATAQFGECMSKLDEALVTFKMYCGLVAGTLVEKMHRDAIERHAQIISLIQTESESVSSAYSARIGTTSVATALLHNPRIVATFPRRYFVSCDSVYTTQGLLISVAAHLGISANKQLAQSIVRYFSDRGPSLLVLDNFETPRESMEHRPSIEEFLSLLTDVDHLALMITMRGTERPGKVRWTRPFLPVDRTHLDTLLALTDNVPLVITLLANTASYEGYLPTLQRYQTENTSCLCEGYDRQSNLHTSITISLHSSRVTAVPHAKGLLSLLSLLPDGVSDQELHQCEEHFHDISRCRAPLIRSGLAFVAPGDRLRALAPIREYMAKSHPPSRESVETLQKYLRGLLHLWSDHNQLFSAPLIERITAQVSFGTYGLESDVDTRLQQTAYGILELDDFLHENQGRSTDLFPLISNIITRTGDKLLHGRYICTLLRRKASQIPVLEASQLIEMGAVFFQDANDHVGEAKLYNAAAQYYSVGYNVVLAIKFCDKVLAMKPSDDTERCRAILAACELRGSTRRDKHGIRLALEAQRIAQRMGHLKLEPKCLTMQATLCASHAYNRMGLQESREDLGILDGEAFIYYQLTEYRRARDVRMAIVRLTSLDKCACFHLHALINVIHDDVVLGEDEPDILSRIEVVDEMAQRIGFYTARPLCDLARAEVNHPKQNLTVATIQYKQCLNIFRGADEWAACACFGHLSDLALDQDIDDATRWVMAYFAFSHTRAVVTHKFHAVRRLGDINLAIGDEETAISLFTVALQGYSGMGVHRGRAECIVRPGGIFSKHGDIRAARELWEVAERFFMRSSQNRDAEDVKRRLDELPQENAQTSLTVSCLTLDSAEVKRLLTNLPCIPDSLPNIPSSVLAHARACMV
ncbi:hypothetical protein C8J57DRAFT_1728170 [Mycena rebaudengoi]|nr:hypothetical protein C8J57DRAFT_1728170 [Mycena rebaudengoi]